MKVRVRAVICLLMIAGAVVGPAFAANAIPNACGYAKVTVLSTTVNAPGLTYCDSCPGGAGQGPNDPWVWPVKWESYLCVHFW